MSTTLNYESPETMYRNIDRAIRAFIVDYLRTIIIFLTPQLIWWSFRGFPTGVLDHIILIATVALCAIILAGLVAEAFLRSDLSWREAVGGIEATYRSGKSYHIAWAAIKRVKWRVHMGELVIDSQPSRYLAGLTKDRAKKLNESIASWHAGTVQDATSARP